MGGTGAWQLKMLQAKNFDTLEKKAEQMARIFFLKKLKLVVLIKLYAFYTLCSCQSWKGHVLEQRNSHFRLGSFREILCRSWNSRSLGPIIFFFFCYKLLSDRHARKVRSFIDVNRASRSHMILKNNSNLIGPCDRLLTPKQDFTKLTSRIWLFLHRCANVRYHVSCHMYCL